MGITPLDIQNKEFERSFRGYDIEDVDDFLDQVSNDLEAMIRENLDLKEQVDQLVEKNKSYNKLEATMHSAIVVAQETADEVKQSAKREAELIRREAEREAKKILEDARYRSSRILNEQEDLFKQAQVFKMRFRSFMEAQLASLEAEDWMDEPEREVEEGEPVVESSYEFAPAEKFEPEPEFEPKPTPSPGLKDDFELDPIFEPEPHPDLQPEPQTDFEPKSQADFEPEPSPQQKPPDEPELDFDSKRYFDSVLDDEPDRKVDF